MFESDAELGTAEPTPQPPESKARTLMAKRLADLVCLPSSEISPAQRCIVGDLLIEMLRESEVDLRRRCAKRVAALSEPPSLIVRALACDTLDVARPLLESPFAMRDSDLVLAAERGGHGHRALIAVREDLSELVTQAVVKPSEPDVVLAVLNNKRARLAPDTIEAIMVASREHIAYCPPLAERAELVPSLALTMFWWSDTHTRSRLLSRFAGERDVLQDAVADVFAVAAGEGWRDPLARKALQFIERRQRNRAAADRSRFASLEDAVDEARAAGLTRETAEEISYLAGVKPATGAQIFADAGGEPLAVFSKAAGLKRQGLIKLWEACRRPIQIESGENPVFTRAVTVFDSLSTDKAQTVLRYWNWSLTSAFSPTFARASEENALWTPEDAPSPAALTARLVFGGRG